MEIFAIINVQQEHLAITTASANHVLFSAHLVLDIWKANVQHAIMGIFYTTIQLVNLPAHR